MQQFYLVGFGVGHSRQSIGRVRGPLPKSHYYEYGGIHWLSVRLFLHRHLQLSDTLGRIGSLGYLISSSIFTSEYYDR
jgi:hypothetical protein